MQAEMYHDQPFLFVAPILTKLLKDGTADAAELLEQLDCASKTLIFFAVNNHEGEKQGGSHWNLIVFSKTEKAFFDFDSLRPSNAAASSKLAEKIGLILKCSNASVISVNCRQQLNDFDCGCFVLAHAQWIADNFKAHGNVSSVGLLPAGMAHEKRNEMQALIGAMTEAKINTEEELFEEESTSKKPRLFLMLSDFHPNAAPDFKVDKTIPIDECIKAASKKLNIKIAEAPRLSESPGTFAISEDLIRESIAMKINLRILPEASQAGNILGKSMIEAKVSSKTDGKGSRSECMLVSFHFHSFSFY